MDQYLYLAAMFMVLCGTVGTNERCPASSRATSLSLAIDSRRNLTGHWIISVDVVSDDPKKSLQYSRARQVALNVGHSTASCELSESIQLTATATVSSAADSAPPPDYEVVNGLGYYKLHTAALTWEGARDKCVQEGGHLIVINSDQEADVVRTFFARTPKILGASNNDFCYVGLHDRYKENQFISVLGESLASSGYARWAGGEPQGGRGENCLVATSDVEYRDAPCTWKLFFVCEYSVL